MLPFRLTVTDLIDQNIGKHKNVDMIVDVVLSRANIDTSVQVILIISFQFLNQSHSNAHEPLNAILDLRL